VATRRERRQGARRILEAFDLEAVDRWASAEPNAWAILQSILFDPDALVRWRAVEAVGRVSAVRARADVERVREMVRRTLWLMNDESGGLLWAAPEVLGAVLANVPELLGEFLDVLASFLEEEPFRAGTRWALWRVALARPAEVAAAAAGPLAASLSDPDPAVRGLAALALVAASGPAATAALAHDPAPLLVFDPRAGSFRAATVSEVASGAI
jgi:hypothetical protein